MGRYFNAYVGFITSAFMFLHFYDRYMEISSAPSTENGSGAFSDRRIPRYAPEKLILFWTKGLLEKMGKWGVERCAINKCKVTDNRINLHKADAVIFEDWELPYTNLPRFRQRNQRFVYFNQNPPSNSSKLTWAADYFNWTMTYRQDSDIFWPYGMVYERLFPLNRSYFDETARRIVSKKTRRVAMLNNNCNTHSKREEYLKRLMRYIPDVQLYGPCHVKGRPALYCGNQDPFCAKEIEEQFKFYLAFEDTVCTDYVSEQFFQIAQKFVVPIVLRKSDYANVVPDNSFIAVNEFRSPAELAGYLNHLDRNLEEYMKYLNWHKTHLIVLAQRHHWLCELCSKLHNELEEEKVYENIHKWWYVGSECEAGYSVRFL